MSLRAVALLVLASAASCGLKCDPNRACPTGMRPVLDDQAQLGFRCVCRDGLVPKTDGPGCVAPASPTTTTTLPAATPTTPPVQPPAQTPAPQPDPSPSPTPEPCICPGLCPGDPYYESIDPYCRCQPPHPEGSSLCDCRHRGCPIGQECVIVGEVVEPYGRYVLWGCVEPASAGDCRGPEDNEPSGDVTVCEGNPTTWADCWSCTGRSGGRWVYHARSGDCRERLVSIGLGFKRLPVSATPRLCQESGTDIHAPAGADCTYAMDASPRGSRIRPDGRPEHLGDDPECFEAVKPRWEQDPDCGARDDCVDVGLWSPEEIGSSTWVREPDGAGGYFARFQLDFPSRTTIRACLGDVCSPWRTLYQE